MAQALFTTQADEDVLLVWNYIARDSTRNADAFFDTLKERCQLLADTPQMGRARPEFGAEVRSWPLGNYLIFYRIAETDIEILRVIHGARDVALALGVIH